MKIIFLLVLILLPNIGFSMGGESYEDLYYKLLDENQQLKNNIRSLQQKYNRISSKPKPISNTVIIQDSTKSESRINSLAKRVESNETKIERREVIQQMSKGPIFIQKKDIAEAAKEEIDKSCLGQLRSLKLKLDNAIKNDTMSVNYYKWRYTKQLRRCKDEKSRYKY